MKKMTRLLLGAFVASTLSGCIFVSGEEPEQICPEENRVLVDDHKYCVMGQEIIEKGFICPSDLNFRHDLPSGAVACSDQGMLPPEHIDELERFIEPDPWVNNSTNNISPNNNTQPGCTGPNPSEQECTSDADCGEGESCVVEPGGCVPSTCSCDEASGTWECTADCGQKFVCEEGTAPVCNEPDPSEQECDTDADCGEGEACLPSGDDVCVPSSCTCTESGWVCTEDCGQPRACLPTGPECTDGGPVLCDSLPPECPEGLVVEVVNGCWGACVDPATCEAPDACLGEPNPAAQECDDDADCADGEACVDQPLDVCVPGMCWCGVDGWGCTEDCNAPRACEPISACEGPDPSEQECDVDADCPGEQVCVNSDAAVCVPSACSCDQATGSWVCTADCGPMRMCAEPQPSACMGADPSLQHECDDDADCAADEGCQISAAAVCVPSTCSCDEASGGWICTDDCLPPSQCAPR